MTPFLRAVLVIVLCLISLAIFIYNILTHKSRAKRAYSLLMFLCVAYPFLDLSFTPFNIRVTPFDFALWSFLIVNYDFIVELKRYKLLVLLLCVMILTSLLSEFVVDSLWSIPKSFRVFALFIISCVYFRSFCTNEINNRFIKLFIWPAIVAVVFGVIQISISPSFSLYFSQWNKEARISSCFIDPQIAGCCIAILATYMLNIFLCYRKILSLFLFVLLLFVGLYTGSKVFVLSVAVCMCISLFKARRKSQAIFFFIFSCVLLFVMYTQLGDLLIFERMNDMDSSLEGRKELYWLGAWDIFTNNWFSGIGSGVFQQYIEKYNYPMAHFVDGEYLYAMQPESGYLLWLDEYGILGIVFLLIIIALLRGKSSCKLDCRIMLIPFLICFASLYNLSSAQLVFLLSIISAVLYCSANNKASI